MSIWYEIKDQEDVELSDDGTSIEVLYKSDLSGNHYVDIPIEFIKPLLEDSNERTKSNKS